MNKKVKVVLTKTVTKKVDNRLPEDRPTEVFEVFKHVKSKTFKAVVRATSRIARELRKTPGMLYVGDVRIAPSLMWKITSSGSEVILKNS